MEEKPRVLLVDSDPDFLRSAKAALEEEGFSVRSAHTAREGFESLVFEGADLVVLEIMLEKHDAGFTLAREIKGDPRFKNIPILILTALGEKTGYRFDLERDGYWMKADDYAEKPLPLPDLVSRINRLLEKPRPV